MHQKNYTLNNDGTRMKNLYKGPLEGIVGNQSFP